MLHGFWEIWPYLLMISGPLITIIWAPTSFAMARPIIVFPVPGGPYRSTPLGGGIPVQRRTCNNLEKILNMQTYSSHKLEKFSLISYHIFFHQWLTIVREQLRVFQGKLNGLSDDIQLAAEPTNHVVRDLWTFSVWIWILLPCSLSETDFSGAGQAVEGVSTQCTSRWSCEVFPHLLWAEWALHTDSILCWPHRRILGDVGRSTWSWGWGQKREVDWPAWGAGCRTWLSRRAWWSIDVGVIHSE